uniref:hypothetical protein n=1 Tax=Acetatifactor sp. TaxID=1872090 RepID=UPI00405771C2
MKSLEYGKAICYSGYREGQRPGGEIPATEQIKEDLEIIVADGYRYIRMYEPNEHARRALEVIRENKMPLLCLVGVDNFTEVNNPNCPWDNRVRSAEELAANAKRNDGEVEKLIELVKEFPDEIFAVSVGNENTPSWGARILPEERLIHHAKRLREALDKPITFCEGAGEWLKLGNLVKEMDFIGIHSYPLHCSVKIDGALDLNKKDYEEVSKAYPDKQVVFTELGWSTKARDDVKKDSANDENQTRYIKEVAEWFEDEKIIGFIFEAFDEPWKGEDEASCERNWGLYYVDRTPKPSMRK